jgi:hypothetical protein
MRTVVALAALAVLTTPATAQSVDPAASKATVCAGGYSASHRPPYWITQRIKRDKLLAAGLTWADAPRFELDHIVPICAGGAGADPANMRLQPLDEAQRKDAVESLVCAAICAGEINLVEALRRSIGAPPEKPSAKPKSSRAKKPA